MKRYIMLFLLIISNIFVVGCNDKETIIEQDSKSIKIDYSKEEFRKEYINYLFFVQQSLQEVSGGDNAVVVYHKTYKLNEGFSNINLVSTETINQAEEYLNTMKVKELKILLREYIECIKEVHEDFVYAANNPNVTQDNVIQTNKVIINKVRDKITKLSEEENQTIKLICDHFVLDLYSISLEIEEYINTNLQYSKQNTLNKLKLVSNEGIAKQLLDTIYS